MFIKILTLLITKFEMVNKMYTCAGDIGYENLKICYGHIDENISECKILSSLVAPASMLALQYEENEKDASTITITNQGDDFIVGTEPCDIIGLNRELHHDYIKTDQYYSLFLASLALQPKDDIHMYVTGLPVAHSMSMHKKKYLYQKLSGEHILNKKRTVTVREVAVIPQPYGSYSYLLQKNMICQTTLNKGSILVIDVGRFSTDYIFLIAGKIIKSASDSSYNSTDKVFNMVISMLQQERQVTAAINVIERAQLDNKENIFAGGEQIEIQPYLKRAGKLISNMAITDIKNRLLNYGPINCIILTGGGASLFSDQIKTHFKKCENIIIPDQSITANVKGYWHMIKQGKI